MRLLLTRPVDDSEELARELVRLGHVPVVEPLFDIVRRAARLPEGPLSATLLTSRNAVAAAADLAGHTALLALPAYCVGAATARAARAIGFADVREGRGDAAALADAVLADPPAASGTLVHLRGRDTRGDLAGRLGRAGYRVAEVVLYEAAARRALSPEVRKALADSHLDGVLLFSPRAAAVFCALARAAGLAGAAGRLVAYCLSPAVAAALDIDGLEARVAAAPTRGALLALLG